MESLTVSNIVRGANSNNGALDVTTCGSVILVELEDLSLLLVEVLGRVRGLVLEDFDEAVEADCEKGAKERAKPVNPMVAWEVAEDDVDAERTGRVEGACEKSADARKTGE